MGYMHIDNLYKNTEILMFRECYALEKIHGTSAHVSFGADGKVGFFSGGEKYDNFVKIFNSNDLTKRFKDIFGVGTKVTVFGEAYGGKCQGMSETYGKELKFVAFDVRVDDCWLEVPNAEDVSKKLGIEFVDYVKIATDLSAVDAERDKPSTQAIRNGCGNNKRREGVVLRPLKELCDKRGNRIIVKHKNAEFCETKTPREVDPEKLNILKEAEAIADEWVTDMRLTHVLDKFQDAKIEQTGDVIRAMLEDVKRESSGEVVWNKDTDKAIGKKTAQMFKRRISKLPTE